MSGFGLPELALICGAIVFAVATGFWVWMLIDCAKHETDQGSQRAIWILVIVLTQIVGALIYFFFRRPQRRREQYVLRPRY